MLPFREFVFESKLDYDRQTLSSPSLLSNLILEFVFLNVGRNVRLCFSLLFCLLHAIPSVIKKKEKNSFSKIKKDRLNIVCPNAFT